MTDNPKSKLYQCFNSKNELECSHINGDYCEHSCHGTPTNKGKWFQCSICGGKKIYTRKNLKKHWEIWHK